MKTITILVLSACLILTGLSTGYTQETNPEALQAADVNADGVINVLDLTVIAAHLGKTPPADQTLNPDVNGDGIVNILDLTLVASHLGKTVSPPVTFVSANPADDSQLAVEDTITLTFDNSPADVTVSTGVAEIADKSVTITGPFNPGVLALTITWKGGSHTLNYTVRVPDSEAPQITAVTLTDGDTDVVPETINSSGQIVVEFNEVVSGNIALHTESGDDVGWIGTVEGNKATLQLLRGKEIGHAITYVISGKVSDAAGNETDLSITFTTIRPPVAFVRANPASGAILNVDDTLTLTFDNRPNDLKVSTGTVRITGRTVRIRGPFDPGPLALTITWADGSQTLNYTVRVPDTESPQITNSTLSDGNKGVDPEKVNNSRRIEVNFSESVSGDIALQTASGIDVGWIGKVDGNKATLTLAAGKEIGNGTTYVIKGKVRDAAGNETDFKITFVTASKAPGTLIPVNDATFDTVVLRSKVPIVVEFWAVW